MFEDLAILAFFFWTGFVSGIFWLRAYRVVREIRTWGRV